MGFCQLNQCVAVCEKLEMRDISKIPTQDLLSEEIILKDKIKFLERNKSLLVEVNSKYEWENLQKDLHLVLTELEKRA